MRLTKTQVIPFLPAAAGILGGLAWAFFVNPLDAPR
jgi:hypothetical protein